MNNELRNCPFCGGKAELKIKVIDGVNSKDEIVHRPHIGVVCKRCSASGTLVHCSSDTNGRTWDFEQAMISAICYWNSRH